MNFGTALALMIIIITAGMAAERWLPVIRLTRLPALNLCYIPLYFLAQAILLPAVGPIATLAIASGGGGLFVLPSEGWALIPGAAAYIIVMDLGEYLFHRAQHRIPWLWAMHSLHHSDPEMNVSTTLRHFWAEAAIKTVTIYLAIGLLMKPSPMVLMVYAATSFWNFFPHMNLRVSLGRFALLLNSPHYHRVHHSRLPEHWDRNFAAIFPVFDWIFGTHYLPRPDEYPPTGLDDVGRISLPKALVWPLRRHVGFSQDAPGQ